MTDEGKAAAETTIALESSRFAADELHVRKVRGVEGMNRLFSFEIEVASLGRRGPSAEEMAGADATLVITRSPGHVSGWHGTRRVSGMIAEVEDLFDAHEDRRVHRLRLAPRAFAMTLVEMQDIYIDDTVPAIVKQKLAAVRLGDACSLRLSRSYPPREFVVQYKESDLAFVSRLVEHLGIAFFFEHGDAGDVMVFADDPSGFTRLPEGGSIAYHARGEARDVYELSERRRVVPGYYAVRDYNYRTPLVDLTAERELAGAHAGGVIEYGAHHKTPDEGKALAEIRAEERRATEIVYTGRSTVAALAPGVRFRVEDHPALGSVDLLVVEVEHHGVLPEAFAGSSEPPRYENTFRAIPADRMYRPPRVTPRPRIAGLVTGVVDAGTLGAEAKTAHIDDQGRYRVRFFFDTTPPGERVASHPVRMLQNHAGEGYGTHFPLKPGTEVAIGFVDGDPDRPIIVGAAPNPIKPSPVTNVIPGLHRIRTSTGITIDISE
ncbi:MAG TPA: type VI secretion system tip protein TssI/VgrG [Minicystis sp.]|nr:type VI secretion system tip protein TssI/VgrG [Minicystis sp.]